jgi:hypothetical protein
MGTLKKTTLGMRVSSTTTKSGVKKMRRIVRLFGRFMKHPGQANPKDASAESE